MHVQVLGIVAYSAIGALNPLSPTWSRENQRDVSKRGAGTSLFIKHITPRFVACTASLTSVGLLLYVLLWFFVQLWFWLIHPS